MTQPRHAGFWIRAAALAADLFILAVPFQIIVFSISGTFEPTAVPWLESVYPIVTMVYFIYFHSSALKATPGKYLLGIQVVRSRTGERITWPNATGRYFAEILSALLFFIGYFMAAFTKEKRTLHDYLARTIVVHRHSSN
jgi:uncharacterized RDD family membrane protein YckC